MAVISFLSPWIIFVASVISAYRLGKRFGCSAPASVSLLFVLILWTELLLFPVQLLGAAQIAGLVDMITPIGIAELQLAMLALVWGVDCRCPVQLPAKTGNLSKQKGPLWLGACVVVVFGSYLIFGLDLLSSFPFGWDSLAYHLPVAVKWLQEGSLQLPASRAWRLSLSGNGEILTMLLLSTGRQSLAPAGNWAALIVLAGATYLIAKRIGNSQRVPSFAAALLVVSIPIVEFQTFMNYVDLFGTAFLAAAVAMFLCRYKNHSSPGADMPAKNLSQC